MKRYKGLIRDTWWVWLVFVGGGIIGGIFLPIFFSAIPISAFAFIYFGLMRYDSEGELISEDRS
ncbi:hypothetical protein [Mariniblastus fucicola]|uniref:Uncharacterized protein n=1 Tax=Mariniblastus fucicola TaxID=980251 RepID=A0A5B9P6Q8_9BACT|nr:hypothetical protein [Mariniblastus fucicola]QEG20692.1 hypothetical protein MFFC18_05430 [Mariniblastus fucicola]